MSRTAILSKDSINAPTVYLFEGGMAREHRTIDPLELSHKIRLASLFTSHILIHPGNLLEEDSLYEAVRNNLDLVTVGQILPVMRGSPLTIEDYADRWRKAYENEDPSNPFFYQSKPITKGAVRTVLERARLFSDHPYIMLSLDSPNTTGLKDRFTTNVKRILADEPTIDDNVKAAILERAQTTFPLGRIRAEVINTLGYRGNTPIQRVARRINISYFAAGASELDSWFSLSDRAFNDLSTSTPNVRATVSELAELSVSRTLALPDAYLITAIPSDEFAAIVSSNESRVFRKLVNDIVDRLNQEEPTAIRSGQSEINEAFRDVYAKAFAKAVHKHEQAEEQRLRYLNTALFVAGVLGDLIPIPGIGVGIDTALRYVADKQIKPGIAPVLFLQEKLDKALRSASRK